MKLLALEAQDMPSVKVQIGLRSRNDRDVLRITCIMLGMFLFIGVAVLTTLAILGAMKTLYVWKLLDTDIKEERAGVANRLHSEINIEKLNKSIDKETIFSTVCMISACFGFQLCFASILLLYGLFMDKIQYIYAWIIFSLTHIFCIVIGLAFFNVYDKKQTRVPVIDIYVEAFAIVLFSYNLLLYYHTRYLLRKADSSHPDERKIVVKSYAGIKHTLNNASQEKIVHDNCVM